MCGILGYIGEKNGTPIVYEGLKGLSYRGYDSFGICALQKNGLLTYKRTGDICKAKLPELFSKRIIGHTRWATHGAVTELNAHPHTNKDNTISLVHNGIIENYTDLKLSLIDEGYKFVSQTDTEVIVHLLDYFCKKHEFTLAFEKTLKHLKGSFAILTLTSCGQIAFARNGSPLVLGISENGAFVSSDIPSFLAHTRNMITLDDGDYGFINEHVEVYNCGQKIEKQIERAPWDLEIAKKGSYSHFMIKEIEEQPLTLRKAINQSKQKIENVCTLLQSAKNVYLVGCGTSYNTCTIAKYHFAKAKIRAEAILASEFEPALPFIDNSTVFFAVSQSGETKDLIDAMRHAKQRGAKIVSIVNVASSTIARESDLTILMNAGPELCVLSTKSCTSQIAIFLLLAFSLQQKDTELLLEAAALAPHVLKQTTKTTKELATKLKNSTSLFTLGRDELSCVAKEAALKIKEVSYIHAQGFAAGELKHGSIALIENGTPVIVFANNKTRKLVLSNAMEVKARGAFVIGVDSKPNPAYDTHIQIPQIEEVGSLLCLLPMQLLAYHLALEKGLDPDKPRNLAKSVTVR